MQNLNHVRVPQLLYGSMCSSAVLLNNGNQLLVLSSWLIKLENFHSKSTRSRPMNSFTESRYPRENLTKEQLPVSSIFKETWIYNPLDTRDQPINFSRLKWEFKFHKLTCCDLCETLNVSSSQRRRSLVRLIGLSPIARIIASSLKNSPLIKIFICRSVSFNSRPYNGDVLTNK